MALNISICCDLLEKSYFCSITNNKGCILHRPTRVVICLKNRTFAVSQTTGEHLARNVFQLWFAWKIVLLQYHKQHRACGQRIARSCDLLEKSYFCSITNNTSWSGARPLSVVICLKNRTFAVSQTTKGEGGQHGLALWFAWKIVLLQYHKQLDTLVIPLVTSCDLLEKSYFCSITNNHFDKTQRADGVVICLKNRTFAVSQTTASVRLPTRHQLWFAWKIVLLQYHKQQEKELNPLHLRCDLLEKSYFCSITNNRELFQVLSKLVVICLKNRTFAVSQTTLQYKILHWSSLWFAWKIVLLQYHKQRRAMPYISASCCDLLEKSYFCSITNNPLTDRSRVSWVVICLKNRTFAVSQTTSARRLTKFCCCDLLEKSYFCSITNNTMVSTCNSLGVVICLKNRTFAVSQTTTKRTIRQACRCDLLEKSYFCSITNNSVSDNFDIWSVVICLKNRTFAVSQTTNLSKKFFAVSCDLLEKSYFCSITNNVSALILT